ncbi:MAG: DinB family protein [Flavobacteriales bacterium]|nr:DinB family protein [Flavobacteriales bacterium]
MTNAGDELTATIKGATPLLLRVSDERASHAPAPGKWCPKEIIGHLLDSANNNLARFVRLQSVDHLRFEPYAQEEWVRANGYVEADWNELVELWARYNLHIVRVMDRVPESVAMKPRTDHAPLGSTYAALPAGGVPTLDWLMRDYVAHVKHHLRQIDPGLVA